MAPGQKIVILQPDYNLPITILCDLVKEKRKCSSPLKLYNARLKYQHETPGFYEREAKREKKRLRRQRKIEKQTSG